MAQQKKPSPAGPRIRRQKALQTRRRVLVAAYELFSARGYTGTTMAAIAARADVAVQTLYFTFHTKAAILSETFGAAILGFDRWEPRADLESRSFSRQALSELHDWFPAFEAEADPDRALRIFVDAALAILARAGPIATVVRASAASDPEVRAAESLSERRREQAYSVAIEVMSEKQPLHRRMTRRRATDILLTLLSAETYHQLTTGRGWSVAECRRFLIDVLTHQLFATSKRGHRIHGA